MVPEGGGLLSLVEEEEYFHDLNRESKEQNSFVEEREVVEELERAEEVRDDLDESKE